MTSMFRVSALAAVVLALALTGCKKDEKKKDEAPSEAKPADSPTDPATPTATATGTEPSMTDPATTPATPATPPADPGVRPPTVTDAHVATADKVVATMNKFADDLDAAKSDCKKATAVIKSSKDPIEKVMVDAESMKGTLENDQAAKDWFEKNYAPKMMGAVQKMGGVAQACATDKDFMAAMQDLNMMGKKHDKGAPKK